MADGPQMSAVIYWERQAPTNTCIPVGVVGTGVHPTYTVREEDDKLTPSHRHAALDEWVRRSCYANLKSRVLDLITRWVGNKRTGAGLPRDGGARFLRMYLDPGFLSTKLPKEDQREIGEAVSALVKRRLILVGKSKLPTHDGKVRYEVWECPGPLKQYR